MVFSEKTNTVLSGLVGQIFQCTSWCQINVINMIILLMDLNVCFMKKVITDTIWLITLFNFI